MGFYFKMVYALNGLRILFNENIFGTSFLIFVYFFIGNNIYLQRLNIYVFDHSIYLSNLHLNTGFLDIFKSSLFFEGSLFYINIFPLITASICIYISQMIFTELRSHIQRFNYLYVIIITSLITINNSYNTYYKISDVFVKSLSDFFLYSLFMLLGVLILYLSMQLFYFFGLETKSLILVLVLNLLGQLGPLLVKAVTYNNIFFAVLLMLLIKLCLVLQKLPPSIIFLDRVRNCGDNLNIVNFITRFNETSVLFSIIFFILSDIMLSNLYNTNVSIGLSSIDVIVYMFISFFVSYLIAFSLDYLFEFLLFYDAYGFLSTLKYNSSNKVHSYFIKFQNFLNIEPRLHRHRLYNRLIYSSIISVHVYMSFLSVITLDYKILIIFIVVRILNTLYEVLQ